ncbi:MAG: GAF domain-containing sensor histidine kinase, partial [Dehalococcoidia bacterium]
VLGIWRLDETREQLHLKIHRGISEATADLLRTLPVDSPTFICDAVQRREPQFIEDAQTSPPPGELDRRIVAQEGLSSWIASPLLTGLNMIGSMGYGLRAPQRFYHQDLEAVRTIGRLFAVAIEHAELYEESQRQRGVLERAEEERHRFVSALAHDLRSPLASLKGSAQLMARSSQMPVERRDEYLASLPGQVDHLVRLVDDLSKAYLTETPRYTLKRQRVDLVSLLERLATIVESPASGHRLEVDAPEEILGEWDPDRLDQLFTNVLTNAVKFSPPGSEVLVRMAARSHEVLVSVTDQGVGLQLDELPKLFQPFTRVGAQEQTEGSGLGLYIARSIVEAHGGRIWAESAGPGTGTTVSVMLPYGWSQ